MTKHRAVITRATEPGSYFLSCSCGMWLEADWVEVVSELTAHMGARLPGYAITDNEP